MIVQKEAHYISWDDVEKEELNPMLTRQFVTGEQGMLARLLLKKGCIIPLHSHMNEQITYVLEGALKFVLGPPGSREVTVRTGEVLVIPPHVPHSAEALEDTVDLDMFTPPRKDWIDKTDVYLR